MPPKPKKRAYSGAVKLRDKAVKNGHRSLYLDIYHKGKRQYEFLGMYLIGDRFHDDEVRRLAEAKRSERELEILASDNGLPLRRRRNESFYDFFETVIVEKQHNAYRSSFLQLKAFAGDKLTFEEITPEKLEAFKAFLLGRCKQATAREYFNKVRQTLAIAEKAGKIGKNPARLIDGIRYEESERSFLTVEEMRKLEQAKCPNAEVKRAFFFACYTGLRRSDVRALTWAMVRNGQIEFRQKKTGRANHVPVSESAMQFMGEHGNPDDFVFPLLPTDSGITGAMLRWAQRAGITKPISFHTSRHTFATLALTHGADLYTVSKLLGHADIKTTQIYAKIVDEKRRAAVDLLPKL